MKKPSSRINLFNLFIIALLTFSAGTGMVRAEEVEVAAPAGSSVPRLEIFGSSASSFLFINDQTLLYAVVGAQFTVSPGLQLGGNALYFRASDHGGNVWGLAFLVGPTLNFNLGGNAGFLSNDVRSAFYLSGRIGTGVAGGTNFTTSSDDTRWAYHLTVGKRFMLAEHVSYTPEAGVFKVIDKNNTSTDPLFHITPLAFSFFF